MITYLKMTNWRIYEEREIDFKKGITFLMGANGSGKTSILEAIAYALTGESALFQKSERVNLLKDVQKNAIVNLIFEIDENRYEIMRTQNPDKAGDAYIKSINDNKKLAQTHTGITKQVEKLLGISENFLRRIIYMAEGDVFNFINTPPKEALDMQIRSVLGLTQLNKYAVALKSSGKELKARLKDLQDLNTDLIRLNIRSIHDLEEKLKGVNISRDQYFSRWDEIGRSLDQEELKLKGFNKLQKFLEDLNFHIQKSPETWADLHDSSVIGYLDQLQAKATKLENLHTEIRLTLANFDGQEEALKKVAYMLQPFENSEDTVPCPVCRKPLTKDERHTLVEEIEQDLNILTAEKEIQNKNREKISEQIAQLSVQRSQIGPLRNMLSVPIYSNLDLNPFLSFRDFSKSILDKQQSSERLILEKERDAIRARMKELDLYISEYQAVKKRLNDFGFNSPEELASDVVQIEIRMLSIRAAMQAIEETLETQQNNEMKLIYEQIAGLWASFRGDENWGMEYTNGYPVMTRGKDKLRLDLRQFSGGEKTALLIQLHTIMAHHFSRSDFLMIDEPLEHLDPINRRSLIKFLIEAYKNQIFKQAIIATFEESLIRKYQSSDGVNIVLV